MKGLNWTLRFAQWLLPKAYLATWNERGEKVLVSGWTRRQAERQAVRYAGRCLKLEPLNTDGVRTK